MKRLLHIFIAVMLLAAFCVSGSARAEEAVDCKAENDKYGTQDIRFYTKCNTSCGGAVNLSGKTPKEKIWNWLIAKGMKPVGAAGIMGNMNNESGFNPFRFQTSATNAEIWKYDGNISGYNGNAWGLVQWDGPRRVSAPNNTGTTGVLDKIRINHPDWVKYIDKKYGQDASSYTIAESEQPGITDQFINFSMDYLYAEATPGGNRSTVWAAVNNASSVLDATVIFHNKFEGSNDSPETVAKSRGAAAQAVYDSLNGTSGAAGANTAASGCAKKTTPVNFLYMSQLNPLWRDKKIRPSLPDGQGGSIGLDGSGTTSDAMVIASLTGDATITPETISTYADSKGYISGSGANSATNFSYGLSNNSQLTIDLALQYKLSRTDLGTDISKIADFVKGGGLVIMSGRSGESNAGKNTISGPFSSGGGYVVIKSVSDDGKLVIANPYSIIGGDNYTPPSGRPKPWSSEQTFDTNYLSSLTITSAYGFKKAS